MLSSRPDGLTACEHSGLMQGVRKPLTAEAVKFQRQIKGLFLFSSAKELLTSKRIESH